MGAKTFIEKSLKAYERIFGSLPSKKTSSPIDKDDHPELDDSSLLEEPDIKIYQSLIGSLQWAITLGRFDISVSVMVMSRFRIAPRIGHMERLKRIFGYLRKYLDGAIRFRTGIPDNEKFFEVPEYDWMYSIYGSSSVWEDEHDIYPTPLGNLMRISSFVDACLGHCKVTGNPLLALFT